ncbi:N-acetylmuramoyl-L-alanine amidase [Bacillus spizizenii]|nr:N-acetylmuramoyl-L-alanine amidase [Bacillus spizizenii]MCY8634167.1 N-acetylmuramoyl-L-alanine amidase [Bacillus spizizenii]MCY8764422.1 N-acetylmuramoyl-L-alanine amidase [Bacillus spizizenii]MCY8804995.1 N-acetylmuramoyl-L-alanine amidase [Bacillus spizizenii]MEC0568724.1 N-acetylmuramoyl-L-alanine amidase [Bacillus spizizenii]
MRIFLKSIPILILAIVLFIPNAFAANSVTRLDGANRYEVAVNVSKQGWSSANTVVIANGTAYADVLTASPLAYKYNAPILLTKSATLTTATKNRISQLKPSKVFVIGGTISVSNNVVNELKKLGVSTVERIGGSSRYEVAQNISKKLSSNSKAIIANGTAYADSLAISTYAARQGIPILLTTEKSIPTATKNAMKSKGTSSTIVVGGEISVPKSIYGQLPSPTRIGGKDRFEVAANIAKKYYSSSKSAFISNGFKYADALAGSALASKQNQPMLFTKAGSLATATKAIIGSNSINNFTVLGGTISVQTAVTNQLKNEIVGKKVFVDAGHGGYDSGAVGNGLKEKDVNLAVAKLVNSKLSKGGALPVMSRSTDVFLELSERVTKAKSNKADLFVSIHANSASASATGTETYYYTKYESANSKRLATEIQNRLYKAMNTQNRGVKIGNFHVIRESTMPSSLVELAFISNANDASKLKSALYQEKAAQAIYEGIIAYY